MKKPNLQTLLAALTAATGIALLMYMIAVEGEPGALPLLLIGLGAGGYLVARARSRSRPE